MLDQFPETFQIITLAADTPRNPAVTNVNLILGPQVAVTAGQRNRILHTSIYGCITIDMKAEPLLREKRILSHKKSGELAVAELKIWRIPRSKDYPRGIKFALFLVSRGEIIVGIDNHKPKGPHLHLGAGEFPYDFQGERILVDDFWDMARKAGFEV